MELEGSLKAFSLPEILQFLALGKMTGTLMLRQDHQSIDLVIKQGRIVNSANSDQTRRLGQTLVNRRMIRRGDLTEVLREQQTTHPDRMLGQLLVERELVTLDGLRQVIRGQLEEEIWELFSWESGEFRFEHRADSDIQNILIEVEIEPLIMEGTRRSDEWKAIIHNLRGDDTILDLNPWKPQDHADLTLTPTEWQVLAYVNGSCAIGSIVSRIGMGKFETYRILNTFLNAGIVFIKEDRLAATPEGVPAPSESDKESSGVWAAGGLLNLFGKRRGAEGTATFEKDETFPTPLGLVRRFIDLVIRACMEHRDFNAIAGDEVFLQRAWRSIVMECPMADLIRVEGNRIDVRPLERYLEMAGITSATQRVYEDSIEGLAKLYTVMATEFSQRMGERSFQRVVQSFRDVWLPGAQIERQHRFDFAEFLNRSLPVAQGER
jgi:hypothetical protein